MGEEARIALKAALIVKMAPYVPNACWLWRGRAPCFWRLCLLRRALAAEKWKKAH